MVTLRTRHFDDVAAAEVGPRPVEEDRDNAGMSAEEGRGGVSLIIIVLYELYVWDKTYG